MSDELSFDPSRLRFIELRGDGSKLPKRSWGGYNQDFGNAQHVHDLDAVQNHPTGNWGVVDIDNPDRATLSLLIFDIDIHKAPDSFDIDRVAVPEDTLVTRSQNGGFHVYFAVNGYERGELSESDFELNATIPFDIDIRGSSVAHHVVAPSEIPGCSGPYEVVNDARIRSVFEPAAACERIQLDGQALLSFAPDTAMRDIDVDIPADPPDQMPTCYYRALELRKAAPDDHPNTHKVNVLGALCGLAAGYDVETVVDHFCSEWAPMDGEVDRSDRERTTYQVKHLARHLQGDMYSPPAESTLRDYGILPAEEHCEECPIDYHGPRSTPELDAVSERAGAAEAAAVAGAEPDGGAVSQSGGQTKSARERFADAVSQALQEYSNEEIQSRTVRHRIAMAFCQHYNFLYPEEAVRGWRSVLYVYNPDEGVYEPRGEAHIKRELEQVAGDFVTNQIINEIVGKVERMSIARGDFTPAPERLVVGNGVLDLHTGDLEPHTPDEYHRTKLEVDWNPDAGDPDAIDEFLHEIVADSDVQTLYRLIAHTLYKEYIGEKAAILIGSGSNGKSMFLDLVESFLGSYNVVHRELQDFSDDDFALNNLQGKLANLATEIGEQELSDTTAFKKATGRDRIDAPVKFEKPIQFENFATLMFATNEMPVFGQDNHAIWRRWLYLDFPYTFDADDPNAKDPEPERVLRRRLTDEREFEALLVRCQQEIQRWFAGEPLFADAMQAEQVRKKMKKAAEPVYAFATECLDAADDDEFVEKSVVRAAYNAYADEEDLPRISDNEFGERVIAIRDFTIETGQRRIDGNRTHVYEGVTLSSRGRQVLGSDEPEDKQQRQVDDRNPKDVVRQQVREMVEANDNEPVPREGVVWACAGDIGKATAERTLDKLAQHGDVVISEGKVLPSP